MRYQVLAVSLMMVAIGLTGPVALIHREPRGVIPISAASGTSGR